MVIAALVIVACYKVPITGRRQLNMLPESEMIGMANTAYGDFLSLNTPLPASDSKAQRVTNVGNNIAAAVEEFLNQKSSFAKRIEGFEWEFNTVNDATINAWCMPGGKVVVYTGIMELADDDELLAVVMGHEIAHAIARHGNERMSQSLIVYGAGVTLQGMMSEKPQETQNLFLQAYGVTSTLGMLAYSRKHESEADKLGLVFMAMAGYNPERAIEFWERMSETGGAHPPEMLSTHPSDETRIQGLKDFLPTAMEYYNSDTQ